MLKDNEGKKKYYFNANNPIQITNIPFELVFNFYRRILQAHEV